MRHPIHVVPVVTVLGIKMSEVHRHEGITRKRNITSYSNEINLGKEKDQAEEVFDVRALKLVFVSMAAAVAFGLSILLVTL